MYLLVMKFVENYYFYFIITFLVKILDIFYKWFSPRVSSCIQLWSSIKADKREKRRGKKQSRKKKGVKNVCKRSQSASLQKIHASGFFYYTPLIFFFLKKTQEEKESKTT